MNKNISGILEKKLTRKEFLQFLGGGIILMLGINNFISYLTQYNGAAAPSDQAQASNGFGSRRFGR